MLYSCRKHNTQKLISLEHVRLYVFAKSALDSRKTSSYQFVIKQSHPHHYMQHGSLHHEFQPLPSPCYHSLLHLSWYRMFSCLVAVIVQSTDQSSQGLQLIIIQRQSPSSQGVCPALSPVTVQIVDQSSQGIQLSSADMAALSPRGNTLGHVGASIEQVSCLTWLRMYSQLIIHMG